ncbi:hypothetical protein MMC19_004986 [Ptychographa xylographoides]|nr:hypothetical protein [Ptychographa xylographoides]
MALFSPPIVSDDGRGLCKPSLPKRHSKYATLAKDKENESAKRRELFLKKVRQNGEDRRWEVRGDQIMRTDFLSRQRGWELEQARRAAELATGPEDEAMEAGVNMATVTQEDELVEDFLSEEDKELEAMVSMLEDARQDNGEQDNSMTDYGSDDDDYNQFLMDVVQRIEQKGPDGDILQGSQQEQDMDVTME